MDSHSVAIEARDISKFFGLHQVLRGISLNSVAGESVLLLGSNGAGKSTLLRVLAGLTAPNKGKVIRSHSAAIGFAAHYPLLYMKLTVAENLRLFSQVTLSVDSVDLRCAAALTTWGLEKYRDKSICDLSKGNQARVALARTFLCDPSIVLLDEPTSNLDDQGVDVLMKVLSTELARPHGKPLVLIATHDIHRVRAIANRIIVLEKGQISSDSGVNASTERQAQVVEAYRLGNR
jgi:sulfonate transport system ATP-binding protein